MKLFRLIIIIPSILLLAACATRPISNAEATLVPRKRILNTQFLHPLPNSALVTVKRDKGLGGSICSTRIFVNGRPIADIRVSEKVVLYLPEGNYILSAWPNGICGGGMSEVRISVKAGEHLNFRVGYGSNGDFSINPTAF
jgi:hypothetical protein